MNDTVIFAWQSRAARAARMADEPAFAAAEVRKAALAGDAAAQLTLGLMLLDGHGAPRDLAAAFNWFQHAARAGLLNAMNMLGRCHELGWGTTISLGAAARCYRAAADHGHAWAQFNLACLILREDGVPGEPAEALGLLVRSAHAGNPKASNMLGRCREEGWVGEPNLASARRWYLRAARGGCFRGAFHTARHLIREGRIDEAVTWLRRSIAIAPSDFCTELSAHFAAHPNARLSAVAAESAERARTAPLQARSDQAQMPETQQPAAASEPRSARRSTRRSLARAARRLAGAVGISRQ